MNELEAIQLARESIYAIALIYPLMLAGLIVGLVHVIFQTLTQIQEATLTFVPKIVLVFLLMLVLLPVMMDILQEFMDIIMDRVTRR